ncbi:putative 21s rrna (uridine -2 -o)-methyltransferase mrm2 [Erysiphe necator]|uniref:rRNA methyltransferase 2, mitochondrial n=1 Tax=Uncinula necator TaxID=52586 RepID=A0A0B1PDC1_UNCNE|nr:putative 21s rrna (uridine -2 -o)-methyltransferase mrm2 [Erysiphe necator]
MLPYQALRIAPAPPQSYFRPWNGLLLYLLIGRFLKRNSSSSSRWKNRQSKDLFNREAKVQKLKSRAAFKLLEIDSKYNLFKKGQTVVDLGYAPGSWSQVAVERTKPHGRVLGIDIIPAQPPKGASAIQGDFLSAGIQAEAITFLSKPDRGRPKSELIFSDPESEIKMCSLFPELDLNSQSLGEETPRSGKVIQTKPCRVVDVVLSDMMQNTSGINLKDHTGSMELCNAALEFALSCLRIGGHFVCKFYQGDEDKELEKKIRQSFGRVNREKPDASRKESKEAYFVALRMKMPARSKPSPSRGAGVNAQHALHVWDSAKKFRTIHLSRTPIHHRGSQSSSFLRHFPLSTYFHEAPTIGPGSIE